MGTIVAAPNLSIIWILIGSLNSLSSCPSGSFTEGADETGDT